MLDSNSTVTGLGGVHFQGETTEVLGSYTASGLTNVNSTVNFNAPDPVVLGDVTLTGTLGGSGEQTITGAFNWINGNGALIGPGITNVEGTTSFSQVINVGFTLNGRSLNLHGPGPPRPGVTPPTTFEP